MNKTEKKNVTDIENKLVVVSGERGRRRGNLADKRYKLLGIEQATRMYCISQGLESLCYMTINGV